MIYDRYKLIYDRTAEIVKQAKQIRLNKIQKFLELTDEDIEILERGFVTASTIERIEVQQQSLKVSLNEMGYWNTPTTNKYWGLNKIFYSDDLERIVNNNKILRDAFFVYATTPKNAEAKYHYAEFNALEKVLFDIGNMITDVKSRYRRCGTFNCGGNV